VKHLLSPYVFCSSSTYGARSTKIERHYFHSGPLAESEDNLSEESCHMLTASLIMLARITMKRNAEEK
jgi:hypothetical protein